MLLRRNYISGVSLGIGLGLITLLVHGFALLWGGSAWHSLYETYVFRGLRWIHDSSLGRMSVAAVYVIPFAVLVVALWRKYGRLHRSKDMALGYRRVLLRIFGVTGWGIFLFYGTWAFHYYRSPLQLKLSLPPVAYDSMAIWEEYRYVTGLLCDARLAWRLDMVCPLSELEEDLRRQQTDLLRGWRLPSYPGVRVRMLYPKGTLLCFSTAGIYLPGINEGHIDAGLPSVQWPFTIAHEMAHGQGFTDEGECNFIGLLTCMKSSHPWVRYSGLLAYWRYLYADVVSFLPEKAKEVRSELPASVEMDIAGIRKTLSSFPQLMPDVREWLYDSYLTSHGIKAGVRSYSQLSWHVVQWRRSPYAFVF